MDFHTNIPNPRSSIIIRIIEEHDRYSRLDNVSARQYKNHGRRFTDDVKTIIDRETTGLA